MAPKLDTNIKQIINKNVPKRKFYYLSIISNIYKLEKFLLKKIRKIFQKEKVFTLIYI